MKGLALETIWVIIIATVGVVVFLFLITGSFTNTGNWLYCNVYINVLNFFTSQPSTNFPEFCKYQIEKYVQIAELDDSDNKIFSRKLLDYIIRCWKDAEVRNLYSSHPCYELHLLSPVDYVTESDVSQILIEEDHCESIENSDYGCGAFNQIRFAEEDCGAIFNQKIISVRYVNDSFGNQYVEVYGPEKAPHACTTTSTTTTTPVFEYCRDPGSPISCSSHADCSQACDYLHYESYHPNPSDFVGYGNCPSSVYGCITRDCCIGQCGYLTKGKCCCQHADVIEREFSIEAQCPPGTHCGEDCRCR